MASFNGGAMGNSSGQRQSSSPSDEPPSKENPLCPLSSARARSRSVSIVLFAVMTIVAANWSRTAPGPRSRRCGRNGPRCTPSRPRSRRPPQPWPPPLCGPSRRRRHPRRQRRRHHATAPPPAPAAGARAAPAAAAAAAAAAPAPSDPGVCRRSGQATAWGCAAALAYLQAYAAKGFTLECPGYAEGREAMTCMNQPGRCPGTSVIAIADPCPQAYMNEASNSFVITGAADTPIDPSGPCP